MQDMAALGVRAPDVVTRVSEFIPEVSPCTELAMMLFCVARVVYWPFFVLFCLRSTVIVSGV